MKDSNCRKAGKNASPPLAGVAVIPFLGRPASNLIPLVRRLESLAPRGLQALLLTHGSTPRMLIQVNGIARVSPVFWLDALAATMV
ncbi:hypothetical protein [Stutzerimonas stutzeri]|uniref:hypothetical protein n=1 Tax=Stutzerimonas stutzeri TaxID=316 RepID=UPI00178740BF|nr:hypothetical protein [Stutzerimonas stutzeri]MBD9411450.1 hypothetical protein [Stutzerimonas stutzeri]